MNSQELRKLDNFSISGLSEEYRDRAVFITRMLSKSLSKLGDPKGSLVFMDERPYLVKLEKVASGGTITPQIVVFNKSNSKQWVYELDLRYSPSSGDIKTPNIRRGILSQLTLEDILEVGITPDLLLNIIIALKAEIDKATEE